MSQNCQSPQDIERELVDKAKAYLRCRSGGMDAPPPLVEAWQRFYCTYELRVREVLEKWHLSDADREDCLQDVWVEVLVHLGHFQHDPGRGRLSTWLTTLARNKAADSIRHRSRHPSRPLGADDDVALLDTGPGPESDCERHWAQARVRGADPVRRQGPGVQLPGPVPALDRGACSRGDRRRLGADARAGPVASSSHEAEISRPFRATHGQGDLLIRQRVPEISECQATSHETFTAFVRVIRNGLFSSGSALFQKDVQHVDCILVSTVDNGIASTVATLWTKTRTFGAPGPALPRSA